MFPRYALCLLPLVITGILIPFLGLEIINSDWADAIAWSCIVLIGIGALVSGFLVARFVYRNLTEPRWWQILAPVLVFLSVSVGYLALGLFAGCFLLIGTAR